MLSRIKVLLLGLLVVLVVSAAASATASAKTQQPHWLVNQKILWEGKVELEVNNNNQGPFILDGKISTTTIEFKCATVKGTAFIEGAKKYHGLDSGQMKITNCELVGVPNCVVEIEEVTAKSSLWLHGTIKEASENKPKTRTLQVLFEPKSNNIFTKISIKSGAKECLLNGTFEVKGQFAAETSELEDKDVTEAKLVWVKPNQKFVHQQKSEGTGEEETEVGLTFGGQPFELQGDLNLKLVKPQEPIINLQNLKEEVFTGLKAILVKNFGASAKHE
jgi:hypothetical protein